MKTIELISCEDYVIERSPTYKEIGNYARLLKQPLTLGMFVPCDENNQILIRSKMTCDESGKSFLAGVIGENEAQKVFDKSTEHQQALDKVIFEGFEVDDLKQSVTTRKTINNGHIFVFWFDDINQTWAASRGLKTISDLVGLGLKIKVK